MVAHTYTRALAALFLLLTSSLPAQLPTHFFTAMDGELAVPLAPAGNRVSLLTVFETGHGNTAYNDAGLRRGLTTIYQDGQAVIKMLRSPKGSVAAAIAAVPIDPRLAFAPDYGGRRGIMDFSAGLSQSMVTVAAGIKLPKIFLPGQLQLSAYFPFVSKRVGDISFKPRTTTIDAYDALLATLYQSFAATVDKVGGLSMPSSWNASGLGDVTLMLDWQYHLEKNLAANLRSAQFFFRGGWLLPFADAQPEDIMFAQPLGSDGHWGIPVGTGFELEFSAPIKFGMGVDLQWLFDHRRDRRLKTDVQQTDFLLLNKGNAVKRQGLTWLLHVDLQGYRLWRGLSVKGLYEFMMHHNDRLYSRSPNFTDAIINTAVGLRSWYLQSLVGSIEYDFSRPAEQSKASMRCSLFYRHPFAGRRAAKAPSVGGQLAIWF